MTQYYNYRFKTSSNSGPGGERSVIIHQYPINFIPENKIRSPGYDSIKLPEKYLNDAKLYRDILEHLHFSGFDFNVNYNVWNIIKQLMIHSQNMRSLNIVNCTNITDDMWSQLLESLKSNPNLLLNTINISGKDIISQSNENEFKSFLEPKGIKFNVYRE